MGALLEAVAEFLDQRGWPYDQDPEHDTLHFPFQGDDERWQCFAHAWEDQHRLAVYSVCPFNLPQERRQAAAELVARVNYGLVIGNVELDLDDGQVRYKTSIDVEGAHLEAPLVQQLIFANLHGMNAYLPAFTAIVDAHTSVKDALARQGLRAQDRSGGG